MPIFPANTSPGTTGLSPRTIGIAATVITVLIWTAFIIIARASNDPQRVPTLNPYDIAWARIVGASLLMLPWGWWLVRRDRLGGQGAASLFGLSPLPLRVTCSIGFFGGLLYALLAYSGFVYAPAAHASVLMPGSLPLWTALLAVVVLGERISVIRALGLALIVFGGLLVGGSSLLHAFDGGAIWKGDLFFMSAGLCWSMYSVLVRRYQLDAVRATVAVTVFAFFTYVPAYTLLCALGWLPGRIFSAPLGDLVYQMLFQGWSSVVISGMSFMQMVRYFGPVRSTMITAIVPGLSAVCAVLILDEPLHWSLVVGLALVTLGILFGVRAMRTAQVGTMQARWSGAKG